MARYVGGSGCSWSSATSDSRGLGLNFYSTDLDPVYTHARGHGLQVRCLQE